MRPHRMIVHGFRQLLLRRTDIQDSLAAHSESVFLRPEHVQNLRKHPDSRTDRHSQHYQLALAHTFLQRHHPVHKSDFLCRGSIHAVGLHTCQRVCKPPSFQVNSH